MKALGFLLLFLCSSAVLPAQILLSEDFDQGGLGSMVSINGGTTTARWLTSVNGYQGNSFDGSEFAVVSSDLAGGGSNVVLSEVLESPVYNTSSLSQLFLQFDQSIDILATDRGFVEVYDGSQWVTVATYAADSGSFAQPYTALLDLTAYRNANFQFRFRYEDYGTWAWYWAVDNVKLFNPLPNNLAVVAAGVPNGNCGLGTVEPLEVVLENQGSNPLSSVTVSYQVNGGPFITESPVLNLPPFGSATYTFIQTADLSQPGPYTLSFFSSQPGDPDPSNDTLADFAWISHLAAGTLPYRESFESGPGGWFVRGANPSWALGLPNKNNISGAAHGQNAWVTGGLGATPYNNLEANWLEGPCFDLSSSSIPWVGLDLWWSSESGADGAVLQSSTDGGLSWTAVGDIGDPYNWYGSVVTAVPGGQGRGWSGEAATNDGSNGYVRAVHDIQDLSGQAEVIFRVAFASGSTGTRDGIAWDNFSVGEAPTSFLGADTAVCDSLVLVALPGTGYSWNTGNMTSSQMVTSSGAYSVSLVDTNGFPGGDLVNVTVFHPQSPDWPQDTLICGQGSYLLGADPMATSYLWSTGDDQASLAVTASGTYWVDQVYGSACTRRDSIEIDLSALAARFTLVGDSACRGELVQFSDSSNGALTWYWDFGNGNQSTNPSPATIYPAGGTYRVVLQVTDSFCLDTLKQLVFVDVCLGEEEAFIGSWQLYPQPAHERLWLSGMVGKGGKMEIQVRNGLGLTVKEKASNWLPGLNRTSLDLSLLPSGLYLIQCTFEHQRWKKQFLLLN